MFCLFHFVVRIIYKSYLFWKIRPKYWKFIWVRICMRESLFWIHSSYKSRLIQRPPLSLIMNCYKCRRSLQKSRKSEQRKQSVAVQNEKCPGSDDRRRCIKGSTNCRERKSVTEDCVCCSENERRHSDRDEGEQVPQWKPRKSVCQRISIRQYASSSRKEKSGYERRKTIRDCRGQEQGLLSGHVISRVVSWEKWASGDPL